MKPIILDRTRLEQYATCPFQGYLSTLVDALIAPLNGLEVYEWEQKLLDEADPKLLDHLRKLGRNSLVAECCEIGTEIHKLIHESFIACKNKLIANKENGEATFKMSDFDVADIADHFVKKLPTMKRTDIQPQAVEHAKNVGDMLVNLHIPLLGIEQQLSMIFLPETKRRPSVTVSMRYDLIGQGLSSVHGIDWKTGYKERTNTETYESFQAQLGAWLLWKQYPETKDVYWWYYETNRGTKGYAHFDRTKEYPRLAGLSVETVIKGRIRQAVATFIKNNRECWPTPKKCIECWMLFFCEEADLSAKLMAENPKQFVDRLIIDEASVNRRKKTLTDWAQAKGDIVGSKKGWGDKQCKKRSSYGWIDLDKPKGAVETGDESLDSHFKGK